MHNQVESRRQVITLLSKVVHPFIEKNANNKFTGFIKDKPERAVAFSTIGTAIVRLEGEGVVPKDGREVFIANCANLLSGACAYDDTFMTPFGQSDLPKKIRDIISQRLLEGDSYRIELLVAVNLYENKKGNEITAEQIAPLKGLILNSETDPQEIYAQLRKTIIAALEFIDGNGQEKTNALPENENELLRKLKELHDAHVRLMPKEELKGETFEALSAKPNSAPLPFAPTFERSPAQTPKSKTRSTGTIVEMNSVRPRVETESVLPKIVRANTTAAPKTGRKKKSTVAEVKEKTPSPQPIEIPSDKEGLEAMLRASQERTAQAEEEEKQRKIAQAEAQARFEKEQVEREQELLAKRQAEEVERLRIIDEAKIKAEEEERKRQIDAAKNAAKAQKRAERAATYEEEIRRADEKIKMQDRQREVEAENKKREEAEKERLRKMEEDRVNAEREKKVRAEAAERQRLQKLQDEKAGNEKLMRANLDQINGIDAELGRKREELGSADKAKTQVRANFLLQISAEVTTKHKKLVPIAFIFRGRLKDIAAAGDEYVQKDNEIAEPVAKLNAKNAILDKLVNRGVYSSKWLRENWLSSAYFAKRDSYRRYLDARVAANQITQKLNAASDTASMVATMELFFPSVAASFKNGVQQSLDRNQATRDRVTEEIEGLEAKRRELSAESEQLRLRLDALHVLLRGDVVTSVQESANSLTK